jgi:hypothetical protein
MLLIRGGEFDIDATFGAAIGTGATSIATASAIDHITIAGGSFNLSSRAAAVGTGRADSGAVLTVDELTIEGGTFTIYADEGTGIGAGPSAGASSVGSLTVAGGAFNITAARGAAIGAGHAFSGGSSSIGRIAITAGEFALTSTRGACIGAGDGGEGKSDVSANLIGDDVRFSAVGGGYGSTSIGDIRLGSFRFAANVTEGAAVGCGSPETAVGVIDLQGTRLTVASADSPAIGGSCPIASGKAIDLSITALAPAALRAPAGAIFIDGALSIDCVGAVDACVQSGEALVGGASVSGFTTSAAFFGGRPRKQTQSSFLEIAIALGQPSRSSDITGFAPIIHIGDFSALGDGAQFDLRIGLEVGGDVVWSA